MWSRWSAGSKKLVSNLCSSRTPLIACRLRQGWLAWRGRWAERWRFWSGQWRWLGHCLDTCCRQPGGSGQGTDGPHQLPGYLPPCASPASAFPRPWACPSPSMPALPVSCSMADAVHSAWNVLICHLPLLASLPLPRPEPWASDQISGA